MIQLKLTFRTKEIAMKEIREVLKGDKSSMRIVELLIEMNNTLGHKIDTLCERINYLEAELMKKETEMVEVKKENLTSTRTMNEDDARRVILGDLKDKSHKKAAEELGLSYGQIYSARGGYTFKGINKEKEDLEKASK